MSQYLSLDSDFSRWSRGFPHGMADLSSEQCAAFNNFSNLMQATVTQIAEQRLDDVAAQLERCADLLRVLKSAPARPVAAPAARARDAFADMVRNLYNDTMWPIGGFEAKDLRKEDQAFRQAYQNALGCISNPGAADFTFHAATVQLAESLDPAHAEGLVEAWDAFKAAWTSGGRELADVRRIAAAGVGFYSMWCKYAAGRVPR
jgi:hypothetical protein